MMSIVDEGRLAFSIGNHRSLGFRLLYRQRKFSFALRRKIFTKMIQTDRDLVILDVKSSKLGNFL